MVSSDTFSKYDAKLREEPTKKIGRFGRQRAQHIREYMPEIYEYHKEQGTLTEYLTNFEEEAQEQIETIIAETLKLDPAPDKGTDQMGWVRHMNSLRMTAEEIVTRELVYS